MFDFDWVVALLCQIAASAVGRVAGEAIWSRIKSKRSRSPRRKK